MNVNLSAPLKPTEVLRILVVDDEPPSLRLATKYLRRYWPAALIRCCRSFTKAKENIQSFRPHIIWLDWNLGGNYHGPHLLPFISNFRKIHTEYNFPVVIHVSAWMDATEIVGQESYRTLVSSQEFATPQPRFIDKVYIERDTDIVLENLANPSHTFLSNISKLRIATNKKLEPEASIDLSTTAMIQLGDNHRFDYWSAVESSDGVSFHKNIPSIKRSDGEDDAQNRIKAILLNKAQLRLDDSDSSPASWFIQIGERPKSFINLSWVESISEGENGNEWELIFGNEKVVTTGTWSSETLVIKTLLQSRIDAQKQNQHLYLAEWPKFKWMD